MEGIIHRPSRSAVVGREVTASCTVTGSMWLKLLWLVVLAAAVPPIATAEDRPGLLHPPPFLESSDLFWTFRPDRGIVLDEATVFDADIYPHFVLFGASSCRAPAPGVRTARAFQPCISITPAIRLRMENKDSAPINSPSFLPRINVQWLFYSDRGRATRSFGLHVGHHSNGQAGDLFRWAGTRAEASIPFQPSGDLLDDLREGVVEPDTENGNFSTNYVRLSLDLARYAEGNGRRIAGYRLGLSLEVLRDQWMYAPLRNGVYPKWWLRADAGIAVSHAPLCRRAEFFLKTTTYEYQRKGEVSVEGQWDCIFSPERGLGVLLRYGYGRDEYNSSFFLDRAHRLQIGVTVNRRRTFGADY